MAFSTISIQGMLAPLRSLCTTICKQEELQLTIQMVVPRPYKPDKPGTERFTGPGDKHRNLAVLPNTMRTEPSVQRSSPPLLFVLRHGREEPATRLTHSNQK